ncbi:hypothetical protein [Nonomuraea cavernae]|uniref:hypothetical protein n=1 Tax=Nonomuraea cavernae TaxID=2045107 RepID=UPI0033D01F1A
MTGSYEHKSEFIIRWLRKEQARSAPRSVIGFLDARGIPVTDEARARISGCTDEALLDEWTFKALSVRSVDELFD